MYKKAPRLPTFPPNGSIIPFASLTSEFAQQTRWDRKAVIADLKKIYLAPSEELAAGALDDFAKTWDAKYPMISKSWRSRWTEVIPYLKFNPEIRKAVYTTNAVESVNYTIQKVVKNRQS